MEWSLSELGQFVVEGADCGACKLSEVCMLPRLIKPQVLGIWSSMLFHRNKKGIDPNVQPAHGTGLHVMAAHLH